MSVRSRIYVLVRMVFINEPTADIVMKLILTKKSMSKKDKMILISDIYNKYVIDYNIPQEVRPRSHISQVISQYIQTYYFNKIKDVSNLCILDVGGANGDVLKNIGDNLSISKRNLYCLEPEKKGWKYMYTNSDYITYVFWDNKSIPKKIKKNSLDVVIIMVTLHHMTVKDREALFTNLHFLTKPGSLLIIKEHDSRDKEDKFCIEWQHAIFAAITNPIDTPSMYEDYKNKEYWDNYICSMGYMDGLSELYRSFPNGSLKNPTNLYWKVYVKK